MLENIGEISLLYDFYAELLPEKQKAFIDLYYEQNCSLAEIAAEYGISRQGVHDAVKKAEKSLRSYEEKLGLIARFNETEKIISEMDKALDGLIEEYSKDKELVAKLSKIKAGADELGE